MPDIKQVLNDEIRRLARKEVKQAVLPLLKVIAEQKSTIRELKREIAGLKKSAAEEKPAAPVAAAAAAAADEVKHRLNAAGIIRIRTKMKLTQSEFGKLLGVSIHTVSMWELGKVSPRPNMKKMICQLRGIGKRELKKRLEAFTASEDTK